MHNQDLTWRVLPENNSYLIRPDKSPIIVTRLNSCVEPKPKVFPEKSYGYLIQPEGSQPQMITRSLPGPSPTSANRRHSPKCIGNTSEVWWKELLKPGFLVLENK